jgi:HAD superfamily phosphatase (TIGR01668 family)
MFPFLKPTLIYDDDVTKVFLEDLKKLGVEGLILDLDNTIMAPKSARLDPPVNDWLDIMRKNFKIVVLTNNKKAFYLEAVRQVLDLPVIGFAKKPWSCGVHEALDILKLPNDKIAVIGDRPLTDTWLGQRFGFKTVLVRALTAHIEPRWKYLLRKLEWSFVNRSQG